VPNWDIAGGHVGGVVGYGANTPRSGYPCLSSGNQAGEPPGGPGPSRDDT